MYNVQLLAFTQLNKYVASGFVSKIFMSAFYIINHLQVKVNVGVGVGGDGEGMGGGGGNRR